MTDRIDGIKGDRLRVLMQDYSAKETMQEDAYRLLVQITGTAFAFFGVLLSYVFYAKNNLHELVFWFLPLSITVPFSLCFQLLFKEIFTGYYLRDLEDEIRSIVQVPFFQYHHSSSKAVWSARSGIPGVRISYYVIIVAAACFYIAMMWFGYANLPATNSAWSSRTWFVVIHGLILAVMFGILAPTFSSLHSLYQRWRTGVEDESYQNPGQNAVRLLRYFLLPRPLDMAYKATIYAGSFLLVMFSLPHTVVDPWLVIAVFFCVDLLAKQTTYIWNDTIDFHSDQDHPDKRLRILARLGTRSLGKTMFLSRLALTFIASILVAAFSGVRWLPVLVILIFAWQFAYDRWAKKSSDAARLIVCSVGYAERALAGLLVAFRFSGGVDFSLAALALTWVLASAVFFLAAYWRAEKEMRREYGWFTQKGRRVAMTASLALIPVGGTIVFAYGRYTLTQKELLLPVACLAAAGALWGIWRLAGVKTRGILGLLVVGTSTWLWFALPAYHWLILALGIPLFLAAVYANARYEELNGVEARKMAGIALAACNNILFGKDTGPTS
jgi:4-hydroxybenzoate polyprenyltransferase